MWQKVNCRGDGETFPTSKTIVCTILIILFTSMTECFSQVTFPANKPQTSTIPESETTNSSSPSAEAPSKAPMESADPSSPSNRAFRFISASISLLFVVVAFGLRIHDVTAYDYFCVETNMTIQPVWWAIVLFNIIPFTCACTAWLRTLVDCLLVRYNKSIPYKLWPNCLPIAICFLPLLFVIGLLHPCIFAVMGVKNPTKVKEEEYIELAEEESLMRNVEGQRDDDEETLSGLESLAQAKKSEEMV
ncbi:hypothetical protein CC78DRAFT_277778 [Lojkania enalia]|uniref:Uncharacterized protein n=1 Tax=Lojkania enalia TaxID=147567 RepID=A0A9P4TQC4_9PLEO|nr:hypothetical protein CC78DRAFT_277778 [Didymosphaeria enalia]